VALAINQAAQNPTDSNGITAGNKAAIAGGVVGGVVILALAVVGLLVFKGRTAAGVGSAVLAVHAPPPVPASHV